MRAIVTAVLIASLSGGAQAGGIDFGKLLQTLGTPPQTAPEQVRPPEGNAQTPPQQGPDNQTLLLTALRSGHVSQAQEDELGREIAGNLLGASPLVRNNALQRYVNDVGRWVSLQSDRPNLAWHFGVIDSDAINAFSAPGGYIFITRGLYGELRNEAELAAVFGHEIAHVQQRHHLKLIQKSAQVALVGNVLQSVIAKQTGNDTGAIMRNVIGNGAEVVARSLDKDSEYEADRIGMVLTARAGYDPYALPMVLEKIGHAGQVNAARTNLLFKTHPLPDDRLDHLAEAAGDRMDAYADGKTLESRFVKLP